MRVMAENTHEILSIPCDIDSKNKVGDRQSVATIKLIKYFLPRFGCAYNKVKHCRILWTPGYIVGGPPMMKRFESYCI